MTASGVRYTVRDYMAMPDDGLRYELIDGELLLMPTPTTNHQRVAFRLAFLLEWFMSTNPIGEVFIAPLDVVLSEEVVLQPDIMFISTERSHIIGNRNVQGAPDLVIEVLSPSTERRDREQKSDKYFTFGVREYWIVDLAVQTIEVLIGGSESFELSGKYGPGSTFESATFAGLQIDVGSVFEVI